MRIAVIGTGVAGSLLLDCLRGAPGLTVQGFERVPAGSRDEAGTGLNLCPNALKALRLHHPARHADLREASLPWRRWFTGLADGTPLMDLDLLDLAEEPGSRLRWSELYRLLREPVTGLTLHDHALEAVEEDAEGRLVPVFRTPAGLARHGGFDLLVAGDGRYSRLRALTAGEPRPEFHRIGMLRLLIPDAEDCPYEDYGQWFQGSNRLLSYRLPGGAAYIAGGFTLGEDGEITPALRAAEAQRGIYAPPGAEACAAVEWMVGKLERHIEDVHWARLQVAPLQRSAAGGRVLFLGDAAHAMVPTLGQGATQAIEDGVLAAAVLRAGDGVAEIGALRDPRIAFIRALSVEATDTMLPGADPVAGTLKKLRPEFLTKLRRAYTEVPGPEAVTSPPSARSASPAAGRAS
ncbi:MAG TPA: FAD-dependent monooxygenase [Crenalkalicoccus sp.]|nr:FAD-dependent monooxygenase [Crenalkalicoccus sp.]